MKTLILTLLISMNAFAVVGQRDYNYTDSARANRKIAAHVWYPAVDGATVAEVGRSGAFLPVKAALNAELKPSTSKYRVVLMSHGSGGTAAKLFWLTENLVNQGYVVLGVDHAGNMTGDNTTEGVLKIWDRAKDLSLALTEISKSKEFTQKINADEVYAAGHSAGGTTVLMLAGGKFSKERFTSPIPKCEGSTDPYLAKICAEMKKVDFAKFPKEVVEGNYADPRVKAVVALDPGGAPSFDPSSLKNLGKRALVLAAQKTLVPQDELVGKQFEPVMPKGSVVTMPDSYHMSFLQPCKPGLPDDPELKLLCANNDQKMAIQMTATQKTLNFLK